MLVAATVARFGLVVGAAVLVAVLPTADLRFSTAAVGIVQARPGDAARARAARLHALAEAARAGTLAAPGEPSVLSTGGGVSQASQASRTQGGGVQATRGLTNQGATWTGGVCPGDTLLVNVGGPGQVTTVSRQPVVAHATLWPSLCATTDLGGHVADPGPRGNWHTRPTDPYVALPSFALAGREVLVRCACDKHKREGAHVVAFRVHDVGPWSRFDNFVDEARRPIVEAGQSDTYHRVPKRAPAIDLSPAAWKLLGHNPGGTRARQANYSGVVDLIVITAVVNPSADRARSARR